MKYEISCNSLYGKCAYADNSIHFSANGDFDEAVFTMTVIFPEWKKDCFIFMPACAYNGNRQKRVTRKYPPTYLSHEMGLDCDPLITDLPALEPDGSGQMQVTSADMSVPCVGIYNKEKKQGFFIFTEQHIRSKNLGFTLDGGKLTVSYPAMRTDIYRMCRPHENSGDCGFPVKKGENISSRVEITTFFCDSIPQFYAKFLELRKSVMSSPRAPFLYTRELWDIMERHFNEANFSGEYYAEITHVWQCGWVGGGMSTYPLLKHGSPLSQARARATLDFLTGHQAPSGFYYGTIKDGVRLNDCGADEMKNVHLIRKSADSLYFLFKNISATEPKQEWIDSARKCADAFVRLFEKRGTFGQLIDVESGEIIVGCGTSGAIAPAALARASEYFGDEKYLRIARESLEYYINMFLKIGFTCGGPADILTAPDSESAFGLLESCITLYEVDRNERWLTYAKWVADYCSTWVVSYSYEFPEESEFFRLGINTVGSVFASVQNKHSAPGICTLSGDSLLKLYRYTGVKEYLELIKDIAYFIPQCVSTDEKPIFSLKKERLPSGYICERVNMSDWETPRKVGEVFNCSCWCETSLILSFTELMTQSEMLE